MSQLDELRRTWGAALSVCEFFGWHPDELQSGLTPRDRWEGVSGSCASMNTRPSYNHPKGTERGRLERLAVELANSLREELNRHEENEFWKRGLNE